MPAREIAAFAVRFADELVELDRWDLWDAGYAAAGGMSDDGFHSFRSWLIGKGQADVIRVQSRPADLIDCLSPAGLTRDGLDAEDLEYVATDLLASRWGEDAAEDFAADVSAATDDRPRGIEVAESLIDDRYPELAEWSRRLGY